jgi:hypothetical protein
VNQQKVDADFSAFIASQVPANSVNEIVDILNYMGQPKESYTELI